MENSKIDIFVGTMNESFSASDVPLIRESLENIHDDKLVLFQSISYKSPTIAIILSLFFGFLGVDRFYIGNILLGILKLVTLGGLGIWTLIDWFLIMGATRKVNLKKFLYQASICS